jgi:hypothetical protein
MRTGAALLVAGGAAYQVIVADAGDYDGTILVLALLGTMVLAARAAEFSADLWAAGRWLSGRGRQKRRA